MIKQKKVGLGYSTIFRLACMSLEKRTTGDLIKYLIAFSALSHLSVIVWTSTMEVSPALPGSHNNLYALNNPIYKYNISKIDLNSKEDVFNHEEILNLFKTIQNVKQTRKEMRKKCEKYNCFAAKTKLRHRKKYVNLQNNIINKMGPILLKTKNVFPLNAKPKSRLKRSYDSDTFANVNKIMQLDDDQKLQSRKTKNVEVDKSSDLDKCLVFPRPAEHTYLSKKAFEKIVENDYGGPITNRVKKNMIVNNDPHHVMKMLKTTIFKSGSPVDNIQGRNSMMRRNILAGLVGNSIRGTILSHPSLVAEIILPQSFRKSFNMGAKPTITSEQFHNEDFENAFEDLPFDWSLIIKRDPVLTMGSYVSVEKIAFWDGDCIVVSQLWLEFLHGDIDGDENSLGMVTGVSSKIELLLSMSPKFSMYIPFCSTRLIFSQSHALFMYNKLPTLYRNLYIYVKERIYNQSLNNTQLQNSLAAFDEMSKRLGMEPVQNLKPEYTKDVLNTTLLYITCQYGSYEAYRFVRHINDMVSKLSRGQSVGGYSPKIYMTKNNLLCESIATIVASKAKGEYDSYLSMCSLLETVDGTTRITPEDNGDVIYNSQKNRAFHLENFEKNKHVMSNQMINNSSNVATIGYKTNSWYTFFRPVVVGNDNMVYYNEIPLIGVYDLLHPNLIIDPGVALDILLNP